MGANWVHSEYRWVQIYKKLFCIPNIFSWCIVGTNCSCPKKWCKAVVFPLTPIKFSPLSNPYRVTPIIPSKCFSLSVFPSSITVMLLYSYKSTFVSFRLSIHVLSSPGLIINLISSPLSIMSTSRFTLSKFSI